MDEHITAELNVGSDYTKLLRHESEGAGSKERHEIAAAT
jgi:hypothetical protein